MDTKFEKNANETSYEINSHGNCKMERFWLYCAIRFLEIRKVTGYIIINISTSNIHNSKVMFCIVLTVIYIVSILMIR